MEERCDFTCKYLLCFYIPGKALPGFIVWLAHSGGQRVDN